jgi:hypothetical protein
MQTKKLWPGLVAFFRLRHAAAHARAVSSQLVFPKTQDEKWKDELSPSFKPIHDYLAGRKLLSEADDPFDTGWFYLKDSIADYLWGLVNVFVVRTGDSLIGEDRVQFQSATSCLHHQRIGPPGTEACESDPCVPGTKP